MKSTKEITDELRARIAANLKEAKWADDGRRIAAKVAERTAQELERLLFWIELKSGEENRD